MARLEYPEIEAALEPLVERIKQGRGGRLISLYRMQLYNPEITSAWLDLGSAVRFKSELDGGLRELAICLVSRLTGCEYEWLGHRRLALQEGLSEAQLDSLLDWRHSAGFDERQRAVLGLAEELTRSVSVSDATFSAVSSVLPPRQIVELVATVAYYNMVSRFLVGLDIDLETS
jgi:AhpD family alkylhydroperoxidase